MSENPYSPPPKQDLLADVRMIAENAGWDDDTLIQQLVLFVAQTGEHAPALIAFLESQEIEEMEEEHGWSHRYSVKVCPECNNDLTKPGGVTIETADGETSNNGYIPSRLDDTGMLVDVDDVIADGLHGDTLCGNCTNPLNEYEV